MSFGFVNILKNELVDLDPRAGRIKIESLSIANNILGGTQREELNGPEKCALDYFFEEFGITETEELVEQY